MFRFFCCLPLKFGVWFFTILFFSWGTALTVIGWYGVANYNSTNLALTRQQRVSLIITTASWTLLPVITLFGFVVLLSRSYRFLSVYANLISFQLGASIGAGAYFIYTLFRRESNGFFLNNCETRQRGDREVCRQAFNVLRGVIIAVYIVIWLIQIWGTVTFYQYSKEKRSDSYKVRFNGGVTPLPEPSLPILDPLQMPPPEPPMLQPAPPPRFGPRATPTNSPQGGPAPAPAFVPNAGGVSLPPPIPFNSTGPPQGQQYAFSAPRNSYGPQAPNF